MPKRLACSLLMGCLLLAACTRSRSGLPESSARPYEVVVVGDRGDALRKILMQPMPGLMQPEPMFDVTQVAENKLGGNMKLARSIVCFSAGTPLRIERNKFADPQVVVYTDGSHAAGLIRALVGAEYENACRLLAKKHNAKAGEAVKKMFGQDMLVPAGMTSMKQGKNFLWLSNNSAERMGNLLVFKLGARQSFPQAVDSVLRANIPGERKGMYMQLGNMQKADSHAGGTDPATLTWRGSWEMKGDAMGGPCIVRHYWAHGICVMAFVYAPGQKKRNIIRQLEAALLTFGRSAAKSGKTK